MAVDLSDIVLNKVTDPQKKQAVIQRLAKLTKKSEADISTIVEKAPIVIFKAVDATKVELVQKYLGDTVRIQPAGGEKKAAAPMPPATPGAAAVPRPAQPKSAPAPPVPVAAASKSTPPPAPPAEASALSSFGFAEEGDKPASAPSKARPAEAVKHQPPPPAPASHHAPSADAKPGPKKEKIDPKKAFKDKYTDKSDEKGYSYEFYCESCEKGHVAGYFPIPSGVGYSVSAFTKWFGQKTSGKYSGSLDNFKKDDQKAFQKSSLAKSIKASEEHFLKCPGCGKYVCASCWNVSQKKCNTCAPIKADDLPVHERKKREKEERERSARMVSRFCPGCGAEKKEGAKFCEVCGASYE